jgi:hypothetical protein
VLDILVRQITASQKLINEGKFDLGIYSGQSFCCGIELASRPPFELIIRYDALAQPIFSL